jgi:hypothetical protein
VSENQEKVREALEGAKAWIDANPSGDFGENMARVVVLERLKAALSALAPTVEGAGVGHTECICVPGTEGGIDPACVACFGDVMEEQDRRERRRNR